MNNIHDSLFDYLAKKIPNFIKTTKNGEIKFTCPNHKNHIFESNSTATFLANTDKIYCTLCQFKGTIFDAVRLLDDEYKNKTDAEITDYLIGSLNLDIYKELDQYIKYGWSLTPLLKNTNKPFETDWRQVEHKEKAQWIKWLNNGLNLGLNAEKSGIIAIDVDCKKPVVEDRKEIREYIINECEKSQTLKANTTSGGSHYVFIWDEDLRKQKVNLYNTQIDTRTEGQIAIAPSVRDGKKYEWTNLGSEIKKMPEDLKKKLLELYGLDSNKKEEETNNIIKDENNIKPELKNNGLDGCCNNTFVQYGGVLINRFKPEDVNFILHLTNKIFLEEPMPSRDIDAMCNSLSGYSNNADKNQEKAIHEYIKLLNSDVTARDIIEGTGIKRAIVDTYLSRFVKEGKLVRLGRGRYQFKEKIEWSDAVPINIDEYKYRIPFFNQTAFFQIGDVLLLGAKTNDGKCINNGYLSTNKGLIDIEDIGKNRPDGISKDKGHHIRLFTGKLQDKAYRKPNYFWKEKVNKTIKITTEYGFELEGTPEHQIKIAIKSKANNGQYRMEFKKLKDIQEQENVVIVAPNHFTKKIKIFKSNYIMKNSKYSHPKHLNQELKELTPELARLIGYILGDGTLTKTGIRIYANNLTEKNTIANDIKNIVKIYGLNTIERRENNCLIIEINSVILLKWYKKRILRVSSKINNIKSPDRYIPMPILKGDEEIQRNFIGALFSCESNINKGTAIEITMASKKLIDALHIMLLNFGIFSKKGIKKVKNYPQNKYWRINLSSEYGFKFLKLFNPIKYNNIILPSKIIKKSRIKTFGNNRDFKDVYFVDKIVKKEYINEEKYVYDFNIENKKYKENNQFWCNGFINHNTTVALNMLYEMIAQGIKPYYIYSESGSRWQKTSMELGISGKYFSTHHTNPLAIELEPNAFTIIDWLHLEHKELTDTVLKHLNDELHNKGGILVIFTQLKTDYTFFAPNLIDHYPAFAARLIQDNPERTQSHWQCDKIKEPKGDFTNNIIPCEYDRQTKRFKVKDLI